MEIIKKEFSIPNSDGYEIGCLLLKQASTPDERDVIVFGSATAVKYTFYLKFAKYLANHGFIIILFDYLGIGRSLPTSIRKIKTTMAEWGSRDLQAVINWTLETYKKEKVYYVGHSVGGQVLGLLTNPNVFEKIIFFL